MAKPTVKELDTKVADLSKFFQDELGKFRDEIQKIRTPEVVTNNDGTALNTLIHRFDFFEAAIKNEVNKLQDQITEIKKDFENANYRIDLMAQNESRNKLLLHGLQERSNEDLFDEVKNIIDNQLDIKLEKGDINVCYRYGKRSRKANAERCRPVLIHFVNLWKRNEVFYKKKLLRGTKLVLTEHLSPLRLNLYKTVKHRFGKNSWTKDCKIGFIHNNSTHYVTTFGQLTSVCDTTEQQLKAKANREGDANQRR